VIPSLAAEFSAGHRAALSSGNPLIYVVPPAAWAVAPLFLQMGRGPGITLVIAPAEGLTDELGAALARLPEQRVVVASGLARTSRQLAALSDATVVATPTTALALAGRSGLPSDGVARTVLLWPELLTAADTAAVHSLLADLTKAQRILVTHDVEEAGDAIEQYAHRAPLLQAVPAPDAPLGGARVAIVGANRVQEAVRAALDALDPASAVLWDPAGDARWSLYRHDPTMSLADGPALDGVELAIAADLPTPDVFDALRGLAAETLVLARPWQAGYLRRLIEPAKPMRLAAEVDRARDRAASLRRSVEQRLESDEHFASLMALAPLFDRYDAARVAAAALETASAAGEPHGTGEEDLPTWVHLRIDSGRRHGLRPGDVVGALLNAAGIPRDHVGRVDLHDSFTLVQVRSPSGRQAIRGLEATHLRGRPVKVTHDAR
jgi:hypothetical protein